MSNIIMSWIMLLVVSSCVAPVDEGWCVDVDCYEECMDWGFPLGGVCTDDRMACVCLGDRCDCVGRECGDNGCGGLCGRCESWEVCEDGRCV
jgi:hypothetical protein